MIQSTCLGFLGGDLSGISGDQLLLVILWLMQSAVAQGSKKLSIPVLTLLVDIHTRGSLLDQAPSNAKMACGVCTGENASIVCLT